MTDPIDKEAEVACSVYRRGVTAGKYEPMITSAFKAGFRAAIAALLMRGKSVAPSEPLAVRPTDAEMETLRVFVDLAKRYLPENAKLADTALSELERRLNRG